MTPEQLQALVAQLTARAHKQHDAAEVPGSPSARRLETMRQVSAQMERKGHFEFRRRSDGSVSIHMTNDGAGMMPERLPSRPRSGTRWAAGCDCGADWRQLGRIEKLLRVPG